MNALRMTRNHGTAVVAAATSAGVSTLALAPAVPASAVDMASFYRVRASYSSWSHIYDWYGWRDYNSHGVDTAMQSRTYYYPPANRFHWARVVGQVKLCNGDNFWINKIPATISMTNSVSARYNRYRHGVLTLRPNTCGTFSVTTYAPYVRGSRWNTATWQTWGDHTRKRVSGLTAFR